MIDPAGKARHSVLMVGAAYGLAACADDDLPQRALIRYSVLHADASLEWLRRWRNQLKRRSETATLARDAKPLVGELSTALDAAAGVRDYLAAKRQLAAGMRADDMEATARLWAALTPSIVNPLVEAAITAYEALNQSQEDTDAIVTQLGLTAAEQAAVRTVLPKRDPAYWYLAADTAADLRPCTLPAAQGGHVGRLIAQINDVAGHLDVLLRLAPVAYGRLPYDWLVRSALTVELNALLDLSVGPPPGGRRTVMYPLIDLCRQGRAKDAASELERLRAGIGVEGWNYVRWLRNKIGAHIDTHLSLFELHRHLAMLDYRGVASLAQNVLNFLDTLGATQLDLKLLLIGERKIKSWPTDPKEQAPGRPAPHTIPGSLAQLFRQTDSPFMAAVAASGATGLLAGVRAGRRPRPRAKLTLPATFDPLLDPLPPW